MSDLKKMNIDGVEVVFHNESVGNRSGFFHRSELFINDCLVNSVKVQYYNRTWEAYQFKSSMTRCACQLVEERREELKQIFKSEHNLKRLMEKHFDDFDDFVNEDESMALYLQILVNL